LFALGAVLVQVRVYSWLHLLCLLASLANIRISSLEIKLLASQIIMVGLTFMSTHGNMGDALMPLLVQRARAGGASIAAGL
jgi:hypothetical protein